MGLYASGTQDKVAFCELSSITTAMCFLEVFLPCFVSTLDRQLRMPLKKFGTVTSGESWKKERELLQEKRTETGQPEVPTYPRRFSHNVMLTVVFLSCGNWNGLLFLFVCF